MLPSRKTPYRERIPVKLTESEFDEFVLKHLPKKSYGPSYKIPLFKIFNYILYVLYTGCQWKMIPIEKDKTGKPEIHYTRIFRIFSYADLRFKNGKSTVRLLTYLKIQFLGFMKKDSLMQLSFMEMEQQQLQKKAEIV